MNILANPSDNYRRWADGKLEGFTDKMDDLLVEINNPLSISTAEKSQINQIIKSKNVVFFNVNKPCLLYTSPSPRDATLSRMPSSA